MTDLEKKEVFNRVMTDIEMGKSSILEHSEKSVESPFSIKKHLNRSWTSYVLSRRFVPSFVIVAVLFISGGLLARAENTLPGDFLYPLKLNINEGVRDIAALTPEAKARLAIDVTERRLQEAASLSAQGRFNQTSQDLIKNELAKNVTQFKNRVASLVSHNDLASAQQLAVDFESSLKAHELILEKISSDTSSSTTSGQLTSLISDIRNQIATSTASRVDIDSQELVANSNDLSKAKVKYNDFKIKFDQISLIASSTNLSADTASSVKSLLIDTDILLTQCGDLIKKASSTEAFTILQTISQKIYQAEDLIMIERDADPQLKALLDKFGVTGSNASSTKGTATSTLDMNATSTAATSTATSTTL
ncbi:MAG: DUF5667 domain-containing protein [bacterium]